METRLAPAAFRHLEAVRAAGSSVLRALAVITVVLLALLVVAVQVAVGLAGWDGGRYLLCLAAAALLAAYAIASPAAFARLTRAATAPTAGGWLALLAVGHAVGWAAVLLAVPS